MELSEYQTKLKQLDVDYLSAKRKLAIEYALSNAEYKIGDIIISVNDNDIIKIDKITTYQSFYDAPMCVYHGVALKKDLTPKKNGIRNSIYPNRPLTLLLAGNL